MASNETDVVADLEAGVGTVLRMQDGMIDAVLVVCEPTRKSIEVAQRAAAIASEHARVVVVANRVQDDDDIAAVRSALGGYEMIVVPEDEAVGRADAHGTAVIDAAENSAAVQEIRRLADSLAAS